MDAKPLVLQGLRFPEELQRLVDNEFNVVFWDSPEHLAHKKNVVAIIVAGNHKVDEILLDQYPAVQVISSHSVGVDHIDVSACRSKGIRVGYTPDVLSGATADIAFALLLASARRVCEGDQIARSPSAVSFDMNWLGSEVTGSTIGIVGMGRIGRKIASRAVGFRMKILYNKRTRLDEETEKELSLTYYGTLLDMLPECDFVILIIPGSKDNYKMFSTAQFKAMKTTAIFVNVGRGSVVDQEALASALHSGAIAAAGIDVTDPEPLPRDHPLLQSPNLTISPHVGSATMKTRQKMAQLTIDNILCGLRGEDLVREVLQN